MQSKNVLWGGGEGTRWRHGRLCRAWQGGGAACWVGLGAALCHCRWDPLHGRETASGKAQGTEFCSCGSNLTD
jgi:hypothetical protein